MLSMPQKSRSRCTLTQKNEEKYQRNKEKQEKKKSRGLPPPSVLSSLFSVLLPDKALIKTAMCSVKKNKKQKNNLCWSWSLSFSPHTHSHNGLTVPTYSHEHTSTHDHVLLFENEEMQGNLQGYSPPTLMYALLKVSHSTHFIDLYFYPILL